MWILVPKPRKLAESPDCTSFIGMEQDTRPDLVNPFCRESYAPEANSSVRGLRQSCWVRHEDSQLWDKMGRTSQPILPQRLVSSTRSPALTRPYAHHNCRTYKLGEEILTPFGRHQLCEYGENMDSHSHLRRNQSTLASRCA